MPYEEEVHGVCTVCEPLSVMAGEEKQDGIKHMQ